MKIRNKLVTASLASLLLCFAVPAVSVYADNAPQGEGTETNPYQLSSEAHLNWFVEQVNNADHKNISAELTGDIIWSSWSPIAPYTGDVADMFTGTFDGNNHTITLQTPADSGTLPDAQENSAARASGLFGYNGGVIKNVTVQGTISGKDYAGGIAAVNRGSILNSTNKVSVTSENAVSFAGGIAGISYGTITDCSNEASVSSSGKDAAVGGIAGAAPEGAISRVKNTGEVSSNASSPSLDTNAEPSDPSLTLSYYECGIGGIVGINYKASVSAAENSGSVQSQDSSQENFVGGIAGLNNGVINNSRNSASVSGSHFVGGIAGYLFKNENGGKAEITNSLNYGNVSATGEDGSSGGIIGKNETETDYSGTLLNNYYLAVASISNAPESAVTIGELKSGKITYLLNGKNVSEDVVWRQTLTSDEYPRLFSGSESSSDIVYSSNQGYTNTKPKHDEHTYDPSGTCTECGYQALRLAGHTLTLDGSVGVNFYYFIDPSFVANEDYDISVAFTVDGETTTVPLSKDMVLLTNENDYIYGFPAHIASDQMTLGIFSKLTVVSKKSKEAEYTLSEEPYQAYTYAEEMLEAAPDSDLKHLIRTLGTTDYYSTEYFRYHESYTPNPRLRLSKDELNKGLTDLKTNQWAIDTYDNTHTYKHYASAIEHKSQTNLVLMATVRKGQTDTGSIYMGYREEGENSSYKYVETDTFKSGDATIYRGRIENIPSSKLSTRYDIAFFHKTENDTYKQVTPIKTGSVYSYLYTNLSADPAMKASARIKNDAVITDLSKALYQYGRASKTYFESIAKE